MKTLGERIRFIRGKETQAEFAERVGIAKGSIGGYENDKNSPSAEVILKICVKNDISCEWLLKGHGPMRLGDNIDTPQQNCKEVRQNISLDYTELAKKLNMTEEERRELALENRKLYREKEALYKEKEELLRENGALREKLARLEAASTKKSPQRCAEMDGDGAHDIRSAVETLPHCAEKRAIASK